MEEKKVIKIKLSTLFLFVAIIAIGVMGYFIYKLNDEKTKATEQVSELKTQIDILENENNTLKLKENVDNQNISNQTINKSIAEDKTIEKTSVKSNNSVKGIYKAEVTDTRNIAGDNKGEVQLKLYEDGTFAYNNVPNLEAHDEGYYTIDGNNIVLHVLVHCGNDIGASMTDETIKLEYNEDSIVDNEKLNVTLKKSADKIPENNVNLLYKSIKGRIKENVIQ